MADWEVGLLGGAGVAGLGRRFWLACGSGARWQAPQEQLGGLQNKGARGCDVSFCQSRNRSQLVTLTTNTEAPWRHLQHARASGTQTQGPLALSPDPQACCRHRQTGVSVNFYCLARRPLIRCPIARRFLLPSRRMARGALRQGFPTEWLRNPPKRERLPIQAQIISFDQRGKPLLF